MLQTISLPYKDRVQGLRSLRIYGIWKVALGRGTQRYEERIGLRSRRLRPRRDRVAAESEDHPRHLFCPAESQRAGDEARGGDGEALRERQGVCRKTRICGSRPPDLLRRVDGGGGGTGGPSPPPAARG